VFQKPTANETEVGTVPTYRNYLRLTHKLCPRAVSNILTRNNVREVMITKAHSCFSTSLFAEAKACDKPNIISHEV
jgi:hypothetical protein